MAKGNRKSKPRKTAGNNGAITPNRPVAACHSLDDQLKEIEGTALAGATEEDFASIEQVEFPEDDCTAVELIKRAKEVLAILESQRQRSEKTLKKKEEELDKSQLNVHEEREKLEHEQAEVQKKTSEIEERLTALVAKETELNERQESLIHRELDADTGFSARNREALARLEKQAEDLRVCFAQYREKISEERTAWETELFNRRSELEAELVIKRKEAEKASEIFQETVAAEKQELDAKYKELRKEQRRIAMDQGMLTEDREDFDQRVAARIAGIIENKDREIKALQERLTAARETGDRLASGLAEREEAERRFGNKTPQEVLSEINSLRNERDKLKETLGGRLGAEAGQRLEGLERDRELWESDRMQLMSELNESKQIAARRRIAVTEMESLRDQKISLESANKLLREANRQVREEVDDLIQKAEGKNSFPSCLAMDENEHHQSSSPTRDSIDDLSIFTDEIRHRIAHDPTTNTELYYSTRDVRSLLGGLAMSRLHLLQGISGTGKTSLPLAFARAIGAGSALIEVQAGWRDRQDLIGHFNSFEKRFYETEFLQALYKARCPAYATRPFVVVLDEMNLSHPEQYFADLLSALELPPDRRRLVLMTAAVEPTPKLLTEGGKELPLPGNIWFFGTANHDETTKDFADKTYDRAHVMELPRNRASFKRREFAPRDPLSLEALEQAFENAKNRHEKEAKRAYLFLEKNLGTILGRRFRLGWGNRLQRQMEAYVPVVIAAGGSLGEATDHILASKLLRKIRDRHDNRLEDVLALRELVVREWKALDEKDEPSRCVDILNQELQRLGHDD